MKAICFQQHGGPEVLEYNDRPDPTPGPGEVVVRLEAAALNHLDLWVRRGWPGIRITYPHILGADGAGEIATLGDRVVDWQIGERVVINGNIGCGVCEYCAGGFENRCARWNLLGETLPGTYAELVAVPARNLLRLPDGFDAHQAAAAGLVFHTAWHSLIQRGRLLPGEHVLVVGASGGVNTASIQIAKLAGAIVYVVGSSPEKLAVAEALGADYLIDRSIEPDWPKVAFKLSGRRGMDVVVDNVGSTFQLSQRAARKGGRILTVGNSGGPLIEIDNRYMFARHQAIIGSTMGTRQDFLQVMELVFAGRLRAPIDRTYPLAEARAAHQRLEAGEQLGKITLAI